jgi:hypothetical protein
MHAGPLQFGNLLIWSHGRLAQEEVMAINFSEGGDHFLFICWAKTNY